MGVIKIATTFVILAGAFSLLAGASPVVDDTCYICSGDPSCSIQTQDDMLCKSLCGQHSYAEVCLLDGACPTATSLCYQPS